MYNLQNDTSQLIYKSQDLKLRYDFIIPPPFCECKMHPREIRSIS